MARHRYAAKVVGTLVEFTPGENASETILSEVMTEARVERAPVFARGAAPGEWFELEGVTFVR